MPPAAMVRAAHAGRHTWLLVLAAWLAAFAARPLLLGFYDDDWAVILQPTRDSAPFSAARLAGHLELYLNRPGTGVLTFLLSSLCGASPLRWHATLAVLVLAVAWALRGLLRALLAALRSDRAWAADAAVALWLTMPWTLGITAWPTTTVCIAAVGCFALAGRALLRDSLRPRTRWAAPAAWFLLSALTYEAFYGQFVCLLLIAWICAGRSGWRRLRAPLCACTVAQVLAVAWNRLAPLLSHTAPSKQLNPAWWDTFAASCANLRHFVGHSAPEFSPALECLLAAGAALAGGAILCAGCRAALRTAALLVCAALGVFLSLVLFSAVGHRLSGIGLSSRTTVTLSFWTALAAALLVAALPVRPRVVPASAAVFVLLLVGLLARATNLRIREWAEVWTRQQQVLAAAPLNELRQAAPGAVVLYDGPCKYKGIRIFGATWNLNGALAYTYPELAHLRFCEDRPDRISVWDGAQFEQRLADPDSRLRRKTWNRFATTEVWRWESATNRLLRVPPGLDSAGPRGTVAGRPEETACLP